jgi:transposase InsO family protein
MKALALKILTMGVKDDLIDTVAEHADPSVAWTALKKVYQAGSQSQILTLTSQLQSLKLAEGASAEEYITRAREIKNRLKSMGDTVTDNALVQILLNGLPRSYESTIQTITHQRDALSFDEVVTSILVESVRHVQRNQQLGDEDALAATYNRGSNFRPSQNFTWQGYQSRARGRSPGRQYFGRYSPNQQRSFYPSTTSTPSFPQYPTQQYPTQPNQQFRAPSMPYQPRGPPLQCYSCGKMGHIARNCRSQPRQDAFYSSYPSYAMAAENFDACMSEWYMDSGASGHVAANFQSLDQLQLGTSGQGIRAAGGETDTVQGSGSTSVKTSTGEIKLTDVKYMPSFRKNLMSVGAVADTGNLVLFSKDNCFILDHIDHSIIAIGHRTPENGLYCFGSNLESHIAETTDPASLWHMRYGHLNYNSLGHLAKEQRVHGLPSLDPHYRVCEHCLAGRQHRERFPRYSQTRATEPGERLHSDLMGPLNTSLGGSRYILVFTNDFSRKSWTFFLKSKSETFGTFRSLKSLIESETGNKVRILRTDHGGEYLSNEFNLYCKDNGIKRELTQALTPQQNGVSERRNRTPIERARSMAHACRLPSFLWSEAVFTANYLVNRSLTSANSGMTPEEKYSGTVPDITNLRIFGCPSFLHVPKESCKKLDSKTRKCLFLGYDSESKTYRLFEPRTRKIVLSRDVVFDEN